MAFKDPFQLKQHWDSVMPRLPSLPVRALISEQHLNTCFCRFSKLADSAEALAARDVCTKNEVDFLKTKAAIISKLFLSSDIPPKLRVRCWVPPRKPVGCSLLKTMAAGSRYRERETRQGVDLLQECSEASECTLELRNHPWAPWELVYHQAHAST